MRPSGYHSRGASGVGGAGRDSSASRATQKTGAANSSRNDAAPIGRQRDEDGERAGDDRRGAGRRAPAEAGKADGQAGEDEEREGEHGAADRRQEHERRGDAGCNANEDRLHHRCPAFRAVRGGSEPLRRPCPN